MKFKLDDIYMNHMVFQREKPIVLHGYCQKGQTITATLFNKTFNTIAEGESFSIPLGVYSTTTVPFSITLFDGEKEIQLEDCLIGDVYVFSGQSNIEFIAKEAVGIDYEENELIRLYTVPKLPFKGAEIEFPTIYQNNPLWQRCTKSAVEWFSAIGYLVGKHLQKELNIPLGLISCNMGDTSVFSWCDASILKGTDAEPIIEKYQQVYAKFKTEEEYNEDFHFQLPRLLKLYSEINKAIDAGIPADIANQKACDMYPNTVVPMGPKHYNRPGGLYDTMLSKLNGIEVRGVIYYQGEQDHDKVDYYDTGMKVLFETFYNLFDDISLPIIFVQIPGYSYPGTKEGSVAKLRKVQQNVQNLSKHISMVSGIDVGEKDNIHPKNKIVLSKRIANRVLDTIYHIPLNSFEPYVESAEMNRGNLILSIANSFDGLKSKDEIHQGFIVTYLNGEKKSVSNIIIEEHKIIFPNMKSFISLNYLETPFGIADIYDHDLPLLPFTIDANLKIQ